MLNIHSIYFLLKLFSNTEISYLTKNLIFKLRSSGLHFAEVEKIENNERYVIFDVKCTCGSVKAEVIHSDRHNF